MKKFFGLCFLIIAAFGALLFAAPMFLDDNAFKQRFVVGLEQITGRKVAIEGDFKVNLLPAPSLEIHDVKMLSIYDAEEPVLIDVKELKAFLDLKEFVFGRVKVTKAELIEPIVNLEVLKDGKVSWMMDFFKAPDIKSTGENYTDNSVSIESVYVQNATINFKDSATGFATSFKDVYGDFVADSLVGPYRFDGSFDFFGEKSSLAMSLDKLQEQSQSEFSIAMADGDSEATLSVSGTMAYKDVVFNTLANINVDIGKPDVLFHKIWPDMPANKALDVPLAASFSAEIKENQINITNFVFKRDNVSAVGDAILNFDPEKIASDKRSLNATLIANNVSIDEIINVIHSYKADKALIWPYTAVINFKADNPVYKGKMIKKLSFKLDLNDYALKFDNIIADLEGDAALKANLVLTTNDKGIVITDGKIDLDAKNAGYLLKWFQFPILNNIQYDQVKTLKMTANVLGKDGLLSLENMNLRIENIAISGRLGSDFSTAKQNFNFDIKTGDIDLGKYIYVNDEPSKTINENDKEILLTDLQKGLAKVSSVVSTLTDADWEGTMDLSKVTIKDKQFNKIILDMSLKGSSLTLKKLELKTNLNGSLLASGSFLDLGSDNPKITNARYDAQLVNVAPMLGKIGLRPLFDVNKLGNITLTGSVDGDVRALSFKSKFESAGLNVDADGWLNLAKDKEPSVRLHFTANHNNFHNFAKLLAFKYDIPGTNKNPLIAKGDLSSTSNGSIIKNFEAIIGSDKIWGAIAWDADKYKINLTAKTLTPALYYDSKSTDKSEFGSYLTDFMKRSDINFDLDTEKTVLPLATLDNARLTVKTNKGQGKIEITATNAGASLTFNSDITIVNDKPQFKGSFKAKNLKIAQMLPSYARINISADDAAFDISFNSSGIKLKELQDNFAANGKFLFTKGELKSLGVLQAYKFLQNPTSEQTFENIFRTTNTPYNLISGTFSVVGQTVNIKAANIVYNDHDKAKISLDYDIPNQMLKFRFDASYIGKEKLPDCGVLISGGLDSLIYNFDVEDLVNAMAGKAKIEQDAVDTAKRQMAKAKAPKEQENSTRKKYFKTQMADLKLSVAKAYKQAIDATKMAKVAVDMSSIIANTKSIADKMVYDFSELAKLSSKEDITEADLEKIKKDAPALLEMAQKIDANYGQVVMIASKKMATEYVTGAAKLSGYAKDMEKKYPNNSEISIATKDILESSYDIQMASRIVNETSIYKDAEEAVAKAKKSYDKAKNLVEKIENIVKKN